MSLLYEESPVSVKWMCQLISYHYHTSIHLFPQTHHHASSLLLACLWPQIDYLVESLVDKLADILVNILENALQDVLADPLEDALEDTLEDLQKAY